MHRRRIVPIRRALIQRLAQGGPWAVGMLADSVGVKVETVRRHIRALDRAGITERGWDGREIVLSDAFKKRPYNFIDIKGVL